MQTFNFYSCGISQICAKAGFPECGGGTVDVLDHSLHSGIMQSGYAMILWWWWQLM